MVEQKVLARMCDARAEEFLWIARANDRLGEALDNMLDFVKSQPPGKYEDMRGVESLSKAIAQVVQTKRDLYNLPTEVDKAKIAALQEKNKLERRRYNFEVRKYKAEQQEKANARTEAAGTVFKVIVEGEGEALDE
jgi:FKBP-type peptidyl-prolyl cis-trans isomerase